MSSPEEWCREQLANLQIKDLQKDTLSEIKTYLNKLPADEAVTTSHFLQLPTIFDCLDTNGSEQSKLACDVLSICMSNLDLGESINIHANLLEKSLYHPSADVKLLALNELNRNALGHSSLITDINLIMATIKTIVCEETKIGTVAVSLLSRILPTFIQVASIKSILENLLTSSREIIKCRIYEIGVNLSADQHLIEKIDFILSKLIENFKEDSDVLYQLNLLELLGDLASTEHGLVYLENKGLFGHLVARIESANENVLLVPGLIKFFGSVAAIHQSKMFNKYPSIISSLLDCIIQNDPTNLHTALDTLGYIGRSNEGKIYLNSVPGHKIERALKELSIQIATFPTDLKVRGLICLQQAFDTDNPENNQIELITETWYSYISAAKDLNYILYYSKNTFPDIKYAGLHLLEAILKYRWGQVYLRQTAGFIEFLLDRRNEFDKDIKHKKYEIIKALVGSHNFDEEQRKQFKRYANEGAFYTESITEVAIEGE